MSINLYTYCFNNPILYRDVTGNFPFNSQDLIYSSQKTFQAFLGIHPIGKAIDTVSDVRSYFNYQNNKNLNFSGYITNQRTGAAGNARMGFPLAGSNACGWVAAYNAFLSIGSNVHPAEIIKWFEKNNGLNLEGVFGINPTFYDAFFDSYGVSTSSYYFPDHANLDSLVQSGRTAILCYINQGGILAKGAHYVNVKWDNASGNFILYNTTDSNGISTERTLINYLNRKAESTIALIVIN